MAPTFHLSRPPSCLHRGITCFNARAATMGLPAAPIPDGRWKGNAATSFQCCMTFLEDARMLSEPPPPPESFETSHLLCHFELEMDVRRRLRMAAHTSGKALLQGALCGDSRFPPCLTEESRRVF